MKEKSNKQFMLLSALGIFFVVDMHAGSPFGIFNSIFNYESFFMQMFVFISGYFFREKNLQTPLKYIWKNTVKLIIPFFLINAVYVCLIMLSKLYNPQITWDYRFSILNEGRDTVFTLPAWFVPMLYFVIVTYTLLRLIFRKWNSKATSGVNLAHFHTPELYISWLFSTDDISEIYTSSAKYSEIYIIMDSKIDLIRDNTLIETLPSIMTYNSKKQTYEVIPIEKRSVPENYDYLSYYDYAVGVVIPRDTDYILKLYPNENEGISFVELDYTVGHLIPDMIRSFYCVPHNVLLVLRADGPRGCFRRDRSRSDILSFGTSWPCASV